MKLQEIDRSQFPATVAWSPLPQQSGLVAAGTVAGTLGVDFNTSAHLELLSLDLSGHGEEAPVVGRTSVPDRFNKLCWGLTGTQSEAYPHGLIAGGLANGTVHLWDPAKLLGGESDDALVASCERHTSGPVQGLDFNPFQHNLLASGGGDSEIFIWDLQNASNPTVYSPGTKPHQHDAAVTSVQWNKKVQHILGSVTYSGVAVVWDLKAKRAVLSFSDPNKKIRSRAIAWNPEEPTQLIVASEDDSTPVIQVWDLRNTYTPARYLEGHLAGIWAVSWCPMDNDLLLSCGKDNKTLCWDVKSGEVLCEVDIGSESWNFDVQWSPRIPAVLCTSSLAGKIKTFSLQDVQNEGAAKSSLGLSAAAPQGRHPPKWLKCPAGATFGFGGKLVSFRNQKAQTTRSIKIHQIITENELLSRADQLEAALNGEDLKSYCEQKNQSSMNENEKATWSLLRVMFEENQREQILNYLGYDSQTIAAEVEQFNSRFPRKGDKKITAESETQLDAAQVEPEEEKEKPEELGTDGEKDVSGFFSASNSDAFPILDSQAGKKENKKNIMFISEDEPEGVITRALMVGNLEAAVECCIRSDRMADALVLAAYGGPELWNKTQEAYFNHHPKPFMTVLSSIIKEDLHSLVKDTDLTQWKAILAILCTYAKSEDVAILCGLLGDRLKAEKQDADSATICYITAGNIEKTVEIWAKNTQIDRAALQSLIEKVSILRKAINYHQPLTGLLAEKYSEYAMILVSQGRLQNAVHCLSFLTDNKYEDSTGAPFVLLDRLYHSQKKAFARPPPFPFEKVDIGPSSVKPLHGRVVHANPTTPYPPASNYIPTPAQVPGRTMAIPPPAVGPLHTPPAQLGPVGPPVMPTPPPAVPMVPSYPPTTPKQPIGPPPGSTESPAKPVEAKIASKEAGPPTAENQFIIDSLNGILSTCSKSPDPKIAKLLKDVSNRFKPLFEKLESNSYSSEVVTNLSQLCHAINSGDSGTAHKIHVALTQNNWEELGSLLITGIKRLLEMTKS